jgi:hypothetical protein
MSLMEQDEETNMSAAYELNSIFFFYVQEDTVDRKVRVSRESRFMHRLFIDFSLTFWLTTECP